MYVSVIYRVHKEEYVIHIRVVAPQEYVNIYSTCRTCTRNEETRVSVKGAMQLLINRCG